VSEAGQNGNSFEVLRQFVRRPSAVERCELCSRELGPDHQHLLEPIHRKLGQQIT
jgi:hypothetical protein